MHKRKIHTSPSKKVRQLSQDAKVPESRSKIAIRSGQDSAVPVSGTVPQWIARLRDATKQQSSFDIITALHALKALNVPMSVIAENKLAIEVRELKKNSNKGVASLAGSLVEEWKERFKAEAKEGKRVKKTATVTKQKPAGPPLLSLGEDAISALLKFVDILHLILLKRSCRYFKRGSGDLPGLCDAVIKARRRGLPEECQLKKVSSVTALLCVVLSAAQVLACGSCSHWLPESHQARFAPPEKQQDSPPEGYCAVSRGCAAAHIGLVDNKGTMHLVGDNAYSQLGRTDAPLANVPSPLPLRRRVKEIASGAKHTAVVTTCGAVYTWGNGANGRLGHGSCGVETAPRRVDSIQHVAVHVSAGSGHTAVVLANGDLLTCGRGGRGGLGSGNCQDKLSPLPVAALQGKFVLDVACGFSHTLAVLLTGALYVCGAGGDGQLGLGHLDDVAFPTKAPVPGQVVAAAAGQEHSVALTSQGRVYICGRQRADGRLGAKLEESLTSTQWQRILHGVKAEEVFCGGAHTVVRANDGSIFSFGTGTSGQLGHGGNTCASLSHNPTPVLTVSQLD